MDQEYPIVTLGRPVPDSIPVTSKFGLRVINGLPDFHPGVDFGAPAGTPVAAVSDGTVDREGWENPAIPTQGYGLRIVQTVERTGGVAYLVWYGHLSEILVTPGQTITKGQIIAKTGATGKCISSHGGTGAHIHITAKTADGQLCEPRFDPPAVA